MPLPGKVDLHGSDARYLIGHLNETLLTSGCGDDRKTLFGQLEGGHASDSTACSGYQCGLFLL
jgi:hypothetical protein